MRNKIKYLLMKHTVQRTQEEHLNLQDARFQKDEERKQLIN